MNADSRQADFCTYPSAILLGGLLLNALLGWWADPVAGLVMVPIIGRKAWTGRSAKRLATIVDAGETAVRLLLVVRAINQPNPPSGAPDRDPLLRRRTTDRSLADPAEDRPEDARHLRNQASYECPFPWHFLYFLPLRHGHGSFRPTLAPRRLAFSARPSCPTKCSTNTEYRSSIPLIECR